MHSKLTYKNLLVAIYLIALSLLPAAAQAEKTLASAEANKPLSVELSLPLFFEYQA